MKRKPSRSGSIVHRIRVALFIPFLGFLILSAILLGLFRESSMRESEERCLYEEKLLAQSVENEVRSIEDCTNMIIIHLNEMLTDDLLDESHRPAANNALAQSRIGQCMLDAYTTFANLNQILIVWDNGTLFYENWQLNFFLTQGPDDLPEKLHALGLTRFGTWLPEIDLGTYIREDGPLYAKSFVHIASGQRTGYVILKASPIFEALGGIEKNRLVQLRSPDGTLIAGSAEDAAGSLRHPFTHTSLLGNRWQLTVITDLAPYETRLNHMIWTIALLDLLLLLIIYVLTHYLMLRILKPVQVLSEHLAGTAGHLPDPLDIPVRNDEVGTLVTQFNAMTQRNQELVHLLVDEKKRQEQLKLSLLQAQIKPHFLYNTLDTIYCLSEMGKSKEASRTAKLLSDFYRHVLSHGLDWVSLADEVRQTEDYLAIQSIRYLDVLDYSVVLDEECADVRVPKLTLQPLAENAIDHGIKPMGRKGHLTISAHLVDETVEIRVIDDGRGMTQEKLEQVLSQSRENEESFGLRSVYERLKIYYGDGFSMIVETQEDEADIDGTCLLLTLPAKE